MNFNNYNIACIITSFIMLIFISLRFNAIDFSYILLLSALFSIIWRTYKLIKGEDIIEKNNNIHHSHNNPLFICDMLFIILSYLVLFNCKNINKKFLFLTLFIFILAWLLSYENTKITSRDVHFCGHCYVVLIFFLTFYVNSGCGVG